MTHPASEFTHSKTLIAHLLSTSSVIVLGAQRRGDSYKTMQRYIRGAARVPYTLKNKGEVSMSKSGHMEQRRVRG